VRGFKSHRYNFIFQRRMFAAFRVHHALDVTAAIDGQIGPADEAFGRRLRELLAARIGLAANLARTVLMIGMFH
jgi:hypothetical protein